MDVVCDECGETNRAGTEFCVFCGAYLPWVNPSAAPAIAEVTAPHHPTAVLPSAPALPAAEATTVEHNRRDPAAAAGAALAGPPDRTRQDTPTVARQTTCPACAHANQPDRYFCARCGEQLIPSPGAQRLPPARRGEPTWWNRFWDSRDRLARRAYRRSLPPAYRWRRGIVGLLVVTVLAGFSIVSQGRPMAWVLSRVDDVRGTVTAVPGVQAGVEPADATLAPSTPGSLLDRTGQAWTTSWTATTQGASCDPPTLGPATIVLTFPPTRIRALEVYAGLSPTLPERLQQYRPAVLAVTFDGGPCQTLDLKEDYRVRMEVDSGGPVETVRIGVVSAHPRSVGGRDVLSITEIGLLSRPAR